ncbi:MAG: DUF3372 domain-containing protein, partial [Trueperaceae bacterium]|nr:DUF3372 domain-containing protein [Trueperaceae bacterium]
TMTTNGMGRGLPLAGDNRDNWQFMRDRLADPLLHPSPEQIEFTAQVFQEFLSIRRDAPLLRLRSANDIEERLHFHDTGPDGTPGVIVMELRDRSPLEPLDADIDAMMIVFNATGRRVSIVVPDAIGRTFVVHEVQAGGVDAEWLRGAFVATANGRVSVPAFSTVVFVEPGAR